MNFIDLKAQYHAYKEPIDAQINEVLSSSEYIGGKVFELESRLADFVGIKHAIACSSGTDALLISLMAIGVKPGDEVITTPFTFIATAECIALLGAIPVFCDIDERTYNIDPKKIPEKITSRTKAIIAVSLFGQIADLENINKIAQAHDIYVIEDGAQSFGAKFKDQMSCSMADISTTSFFPAKPLGCYGDGGAIFTNSDSFAAEIRIILNHGQTEKYVHSRIGINGRLDALQAGILLAKLDYFQDEILTRNSIANIYLNNINNGVLPYVAYDNLSVWAQFCIMSPNRDSLMSRCELNKIPTAIYYPIPLHLQKVFSNLGYKIGDFPVSEAVSKQIFAIPMSPFLTTNDQSLIIETLNYA